MDYDNPQFIAAIKKILGRYFQPKIDSVAPEHASTRENQEAPQDISLISETTPSPKSQKETSYSRPDQTPLWKMVLETAAVFVGIYVAYIYHGQLVVMQGQLGEIIKQYPEIQISANANVKVANETEIAVKDAADNFRIGQRAWAGVGMFVVTPKPNGTPDNLIPYKLASTNTGLTPALDFYIEQVVMIKDRPYLIESDFSEATIRRLKDIDKRVDPNRHSHNPVLPNVAPNTSQTFYWPIPPANKHLFIAGTAYYKDIFGHPHKTLFCGHLVGNALPLCNIHNTMD
jgi:hypothetical protein